MSRPARVWLVTSGDLPDGTPDDRLLAAALRDRGVDARFAVWRDPAVRWDAADAVVVRSPWDYPEHHEAFLAWADDVAARVRLDNPAPVLRWNTDKTYLRVLADAGVRLLPTRFVDAPAALPDVLAGTGWDELVLKPAVSAGARGTRRLAADDPAAQAHLDELVAAGTAMVQPYRPTVIDGEVSVLVVDGAITHAVVKRPARGDFRVQASHGGSIAAVPVDAGLRAAADAVLQAARRLPGADEPLLYARVDLLPDPQRGPAGGWELVELEVTEPAMFLAEDPRAAVRMADAVRARLAA